MLELAVDEARQNLEAWASKMGVTVSGLTFTSFSPSAIAHDASLGDHEVPASVEGAFHSEGFTFKVSTRWRKLQVSLDGDHHPIESLVDLGAVLERAEESARKRRE